MSNNLDSTVVDGFGDEWSRFDYSSSSAELTEIFNSYFGIFSWDQLPDNAVGFDLGCGSGRWARLVAPKVGRLHLIDPSIEALTVARKNLLNSDNCEFHLASVDQIPLDDESMDFGYSLGVLHHVPDTENGIKACVAKLKKDAPFLIYLYYSFDNRPWWYKKIWKMSEIGRNKISHCPYGVRYMISEIIALSVYWPIAKSGWFLEKLGFNLENMPLSAYRDKSFYVMRNDALDRFGTRLEKRFSRIEIHGMLERAGLRDIIFSDYVPYWCAVGYKK